jgi:hypothetical protein
MSQKIGKTGINTASISFVFFVEFLSGRPEIPAIPANQNMKQINKNRDISTDPTNPNCP